MFADYLTKYGDLDTAKASIDKYQALLNRVDTEVAPLLLGISPHFCNG